MSGADFLDTNILVYSIDHAHPGKQKIAQHIVSEACSLGTAIVSAQVIQETLNVTTKKFVTTLKQDDMERLLRDVWTPLMKVLPSFDLFHHAQKLHFRYQFAFYDSLIIAAALSAGCKRLLSEDMQHGQVIEGLKIVNPFA